jgi:hypothetical protein
MACVKQRRTIRIRAELHLVHDRCDARCGDELVQLCGVEVETPIDRA